jgi:flagellar basal-body rod protein FlgB
MDGLNSQFDLLSSLLDTAALRHRVIAQNVANVNTPGYRRQEVQFEDALAQALKSGSDPGAHSVQPRIVEGKGDVGRADGNTVDIDAEMGRLSKNNILYRFFGQVLNGNIATMRSAITGKS